MELWLIRHPPPLVAADICYGQLDLAVAPAALAAAALQLRPRLPTKVALYTSPARRCFDLARRLQPRPTADPRLLERGFGAWEGKTWDEIGRAALDRWAADPWNFTPPGGESTRALIDRVSAVLERTIDAGHPCIWITHQGVARVVAARLLDLPAARWMSLRLDFAGVWHFRRARRGWRLVPPR